jgi:putative spermidine/putrescine transport system permease protein
LGTDLAVAIGLVYFLFPIATMALVGPINNVDQTLEQAAANLGAANTKAFFDITLPLSMPGIIASTLLTYALAVSSFIAPMFLGSGIAPMMSNIIYLRYSETFNYPGGSALAVVLLVTSLSIAYGLNKVLTKRLKGFG